MRYEKKPEWILSGLRGEIIIAVDLKVLFCCGQRALPPQRPTVTNYGVFLSWLPALSPLAVCPFTSTSLRLT